MFPKYALTLFLTAAPTILFLNCGGSNNTKPPVIISFTAAKSQITIGSNTTLVATFSDGTGMIDQGVGSITNDQPVVISPKVPTTYTITVSNSAGVVTTMTTTVAVLFQITGAMNSARIAHTATLLPNGQILIAGGVDATDTVLSSAELYNPVTGTFTATGSMTVARSDHSAVLLPNGQVLLVGGGGPLSSAEAYNPATGTFTALAAMTAARVGPMVTLLPTNGLVLIAGGFDGKACLASAELYNPYTGTFSPTGSMSTARTVSASTATLLPTIGQVLFAGGADDTLAPIATAELYDPIKGSFSITGPLNNARAFHAATLLPGGKVLVAGGQGESNGSAINQTSAEVFDPTEGKFAFTGSLNTARELFPMVLLPNGQVILAGGTNSNDSFISGGECYDPVTGNFSVSASLALPRIGGVAVVLPDGAALFVGGRANTNLPTTDAEIYP